VSLGEDSIMTNRAAAEIVGPTDHALLSEWAERELRGDRRASELSLSNGMSVIARLEPVTDGTEVVGALIRLHAAAPPDVIGGRARSPSGRHRQRFGWASLTDTERKIVDLIAEGLTNAEAGRRLFLSHHTVEYHLKSIYRKLEIRTRLQLAVLVMERATTLT
jgi:DNA-binding CsgD family transcriptional regulator